MNDNIDFDIDDLLEGDSIFKPLSDGLGFHHSIKEKDDVKTSLDEQSIQLKNDLDNRARVLNRENQISKSKLSSESVNMGDLAPFYQNEAAPEFTLESNKEELEVSIQEESVQNQNDDAGLVLRFSAWILDLVIVLSLVTLTASTIIFASSIPLSYIRENLYNVDVVLAYSSMALMLYIFYFSFFDKTNFSSIGKRLLNLQVVTTQGNSVTMLQAASRTILTLLSSLTLGMISILLFQDKLTDTKVIKK